jgi:uncharacterized glyoxalase superfamily metalloenzyme YdcJ
MYRHEVPPYGTLLDLVARVDERCLAARPGLRDALEAAGEFDRLALERHGAIRLGTAEELGTMRRLFAVLGMFPVGYYDLTVAGLPVHSTAFRPVDDAALARQPFRMFTSLLRLDKQRDRALRDEVEAILAQRRIFSPRLLTLIEKAELDGGLEPAEGEAFVAEAVAIFRWRGRAAVDASTYRRFVQADALLADVVCFEGPHLNHLTPRTLDIDAVQRAMGEHGLDAKTSIEGPPARRCPILLRQTSFKALAEPVTFAGVQGGREGQHRARFGEVEQRGAALTPRGRALYDKLLARHRQQVDEGPNDDVQRAFADFPDDERDLRLGGLAYFRYLPTAKGLAARGLGHHADPLEALVDAGLAEARPIVYEDFLPVSAAGIFRSNLDSAPDEAGPSDDARAAFERALGVPVLDPFALYDAASRRSVAWLRDALSGGPGSQS